MQNQSIHIYKRADVANCWNVANSYSIILWFSLFAFWAIFQKYCFKFDALQNISWNAEASYFCGGNVQTFAGEIFMLQNINMSQENGKGVLSTKLQNQIF